MNRRQFLLWSGGAVLGLAAAAAIGAPAARAAAGAPLAGRVVTPRGAFRLDRADHALEALGPDGAVRWRVGGLGAEPGRFNAPTALDTDGRGRVYVLDRGNARVQVFEADGRFVAAFAAGVHPRDLAVDAEGRVGVADAMGAWRLYQEGRLIAEVEGLGCPAGVAVTPDGRWHVLDRAGARVVVLGSDGRPLETFALPAGAVAHSIASDDRGRVAVLDGMSGEVHVYDRGARVERAALAMAGGGLGWTGSGWQRGA